MQSFGHEGTGMKLNRTIAQRIVEHVSQGVPRSISVVGEPFSVLASTNPAFIGKHISPNGNEDTAPVPAHQGHARG